MTPWKYLYVLSGSRAFRHRGYVAAAAVEIAAIAAAAGIVGRLIAVRPPVADGVAGFSERHAFGPVVRYFSLGDEAVVNAAAVGLMLVTVLVVIVLGWLWHRRLAHLLPSPENEAAPPEAGRGEAPPNDTDDRIRPA